jgi:hypothetical protein
VAYEFVEAFSSVFPKIRITQIIAVLGIVADLSWRVWRGNFIHPSFVDVIAALLVGFYLGKRPKAVRSDGNEKSRWIRLS